MAYLLDANILLRFSIQSDPQHPLVRDAIDALAAREEALHVAPQSLFEAYAVATRPTEARGGYGMTPTEGAQMIRSLTVAFPLLPDRPDAFPIWLTLVQQFGVSGVHSHDCRLVAFMRAHGVTSLLTLNGKDFQRYAPIGIVAESPGEIVDSERGASVASGGAAD